eukprot:TRINITY_DN16679_c0_g1_i1.p2 TRINITY_DN16679_c0_g1~~TRINITY_DN16679_c0_g1_i1.p2  ORF type:complete len:237 (+),score=42.33 TRINITY_DN16679_c0_g1_i1:179-889(+)
MAQRVLLQRGFQKPGNFIVRSRVCRCDRRSQTRVGAKFFDSSEKLRTNIAGIVLSVATVGQICFALPSFAQIETVSADSAVQTAKAIPEQQFDKGKIWLLLVGGAASLLFLTIQVENVEQLFPAISSANKAMQTYRQREKEQTKQVEKVAQEEKQMKRIDAAVEAGMRQAKMRQQQQQQQQSQQQQQQYEQQLTSQAETENSDGKQTPLKSDSNKEQIQRLEDELERRRQQQQEVS